MLEPIECCRVHIRHDGQLCLPEAPLLTQLANSLHTHLRIVISNGVYKSPCAEVNRALLGRWDPEVLADLLRQDVGYLGMARNRYGCSGVRVAPYAVPRSLPAEFAAVAPQVPLELAALHTSRGSRITSRPSVSLSASSRRTSRSSLTASWIISRASSRVLPWLWAPGISGTETTHQPSWVCS